MTLFVPPASELPGPSASSGYADLPAPIDARWRPLRTGLVDLFYYDVEEFHFHRGCLLLRGNNGTGKSKVLALTLPFLLDGELAPHRVEPDGDRNKRMEWNLLLGGRHPHSERLGYTWLEFGRRDADGTEHYRTVGCGLKAVSGRGIARHWFFVTDQRIGVELNLLNPTGTALLRDRLREAIGVRGMVYDRAGDYRRAVDEALFGLGSRYEALVSLLIQLRQPQLSKRPDERLLSRALTEALPPLDENLVTQVAEAFRSLDDERETLRGLQETKKAADDFLTTYRRYAKVAARRRAAGPRQAQSRYEQLGRDLGEQERAHRDAQERLDAAVRRLTELADEGTRLAARQRALEESPEMRAARDLRQAEEIAASRERIAENQRIMLGQANRTAHDLARRCERERERADAARAERDRIRAALAGHAEAARIIGDHESRVVAAFDADLPPYLDAQRAGQALVSWRTTSLTNLDDLLRQAQRADAEARGARETVDRLSGELADAAARVLAAEERSVAEGGQLVADLRRHLRSTVELRIPDLDEVLTALEAWVESLDGDNPATVAGAETAHTATTELGRREARLDADRSAAQQRRDEIEANLCRLAEGGHDAPPAPYTRSTAARGGPGAPLWKLVDFAPQVSEADRAGLEAALEAAGLLDAWVSPDGRLLAPETDDVLLTVGTETADNLNRLLIPAVDAADPQAAPVPLETVRAILAGIGSGPGSAASTWVATDGTFQNGPLRGRWRKTAASHIGEGAREANRRAQIAQLRADRDRLDAELDTLDTELADVTRRQRQLAAEHRALPTDTALREAHTVVRAEQETRRRLATEHQQAEVRAAAAVAAAEREHARVREFAEDVDLPVERRELDAVTEGLRQYRVALDTWWPAGAAAVSAEENAEQLVAEHAEALARLEPLAAEHAEADEQARSARERHRVLVEASGASVAELEAQLTALAAERTRVKGEEKQARDRERQAVEARGVAEGRRLALTDELEQAARDRDAQVETLRQFASTGLLALACPELPVPDPAQPWASTPAVQLARAVDRTLSEVDESDRRWELAQQAVSTGSKHLTDGLSAHGHTAILSVRDDVMVVDATFQGRTQPIAGLAVALTEEVDERQRILSAHEREVLENHLVNEVAGSLQELISAAEHQVATMNRELEERPTSTGMRLRLLWRTARDAPAHLAELRDRQLRQSTDVWSEEDRRAVGAFLQQQITNERLRDDTGTWTEQLTRALDYRSWHDFTIQRYQDGQWRPATGPASGGERVLAASIPLFAAAASYYSSAANPHAPRLIALDEAFAGVDDDSRAKCLGLLATFDLDVVMTSEREWGCYPQVPGLAIAQLARRDGIDAVLVTPWRWDGAGHRYQVPRPRPFQPTQPE